MHPTQGVEAFGNLFFTVVYAGDPLTFVQNFTDIVPREGTPRSGALNARGVSKYSDFGPIEGYISKTVGLQDRRIVSIKDE